MRRACPWFTLTEQKHGETCHTKGIQTMTDSMPEPERSKFESESSAAAFGRPAPGGAPASRSARAPAARAKPDERVNGSLLTVQDGTQIYFKDWGDGPPVVFSHGWPLNADAWEDQMEFLAEHGFRTIAHDRRGHGRSSQPWNGNDMDTYADDLATLIEALDLEGATLIGHSTGGGEVSRYIGRHGTDRVARAVLVGAVPPLMLKTPANAGGLPLEVFDAIRNGVAKDRAQYFKDFTLPFYGYNRPGAKVSQGVRDAFWLAAMQCGLRNALDCIKAFSETDFTADLKRFDVPTLIVHGEDDQIVPIGASATLSAKLVKGARLLVYPGAPHGLPTTLKDKLNADLLAFLKS
jgi:non-heme chloroperoxidase